jgi:hypothetical protein
MTEGARRSAASVLARRLAGASTRTLQGTLGGAERTRVILLLAAVLGLSSADAATVGAAATQLRADLDISNTDVGPTACTERGCWESRSSSGAPR